MGNYYLSTTGLSEIWDLNSKKILLLGPWCFTDEKNRKLLEGKEYTLISSPWKPATRLKDAADYCYRMYNELLPQLVEGLNRIHEVSYPLKYWRVLIGVWLQGFIEAFYDRYRRIENALMLYPDMVTHVMPLDNCRLSACDTINAFLTTARDDFSNLKLFSLVAYELCPDNVIGTDYTSEPKRHQIPHSWKRKLLNRLLKMVGISKNSSILLSDMYHLRSLDMLALKWKAGKGTLRFINFEPLSEISDDVELSYELRQAFKIERAKDRFQSLLYRTIPNAIPECYIERYKRIREFINCKYTFDTVRAMGSAMGWYFNEPFKFYCAQATEKGAQTIEFQNGGGYGMFLSIEQETQALEKDMFYTWGWTKEHKNKVLPLPSARLSKIRDIHLQRSENIVFVGIGMFRYHYRFHNSPQPDDIPKYFEDKGIFYQALPDGIKEKIQYHPYSEVGWNEIERVKKVCPNIKFQFRDRLIDWLKKAKLVVIDHPQTAFLEALAINVPTILYWDHEVFLMRPEAETFYELLRKAEIVHKRPEDAAIKLKKVYDDPLSWWVSKDVQEARIGFLDQFGYSRKDWMKIWTEEFNRIKNKPE